MASSNVLKILYVLDMLKRTDEFHPINSTQIVDKLKEEGFTAERRAITNYVRALREELGYDIETCEHKNKGWYMLDQTFEDHELKMLVDAVASAKFLTAKETRELHNKILSLATIEGKRIIKAGMVMEESLKLVDSQFAYKFDSVMRAVANHVQIRFQYEEMGKGNKKVLKKDGAYYQITPYYLGVWRHEYFVVANTNGYANTSFYRVDMMRNVQMLDVPGKPMSEVDELKGIGKNGRTFGDFIKETINLRNGDVKDIKISGINKLRKEVMKKFGNDITIRDQGDDRFIAYIDAADSQGFYQWIAQYGCNMKIEAPKECVEKYKVFLQDVMNQY